jgi:metallo-beta-lactamase family protein
MRLGFFGAAGTVTGSKYLLETGDRRILVDCGLYQGVKALRLRNWKPLPFDVDDLDAVLLTHAHIDHSGYLPALARNGYDGPIYCSPPTRDLCGILLPDAGHLQEEDAEYANRKGFSKHRPARPLYTEEDGARAAERCRPVAFHEWHELGDLAFRLWPAGHILGAASVEIRHGQRTLLFSGDLGRDDDLLMHPPQRPERPDWIVVESTYGDRIHPRRDPLEALADVVTRTAGRGGVVLIPSFAVGRAQTLLYCLHEIFQRGLAPELPVFVNSPMATDVTELFRHSVGYHRLSEDLCNAVCDVARYVRSVEESRELAGSRYPMVIISASGMATGGRVLHHLKALAPDHRNTILIVGFQAPGTRGDALVGGARTIKIHGGQVPVEAEVVQLDLFSAHADQRGLLDWLGAGSEPPREVFVTHGEPVAADTLRRLAAEELGCPTRVPEHLEQVELTGS